MKIQQQAVIEARKIPRPRKGESLGKAFPKLCTAWEAGYLCDKPRGHTDEHRWPARG